MFIDITNIDFEIRRNINKLKLKTQRCLHVQRAKIYTLGSIKSKPTL